VATGGWRHANFHAILAETNLSMKVRAHELVGLVGNLVGHCIES
jgi:hypothetical protein